MPDTKAQKGDKDRKRVKFVYVYNRNDSPHDTKAAVERRGLPTTAEEAIEELFTHNALYADFIHTCQLPPSEPTPSGQTTVKVKLTPREVGLDRDPVTKFPKQKPFAAFLGCVDARAPVEIVFAQGFDDIYTFRIAGNTLGPDCTASLHYALHKLAALEGTPCETLPDRTLRLVVALGHSDCGAVTAAVDTVLGKNDLSKNENEFLVQDSVRGLLGRIHHPAVNLASKALPAGSFGCSEDDVKLHRLALIELAVYLNAAWSGHDMKDVVEHYSFVEGKEVEVRYGVFDPRDCYVRADEGYRFDEDRLAQPENAEQALGEPPADLHELNEIAEALAEILKRQHSGGKKSLERFFRMS